MPLLLSRLPMDLKESTKGTKYPQHAFANGIALIVIIAILYGPRPAPKAK
jgi:hypothetical protein